MKIYWIEFDFKEYKSIPPGLIIGCGITTFDYSDALSILKTNIFKREEIPPIKHQIENVDISELDINHVIPNMGQSNIRGIWFPFEGGEALHALKADNLLPANFQGWIRADGSYWSPGGQTCYGYISDYFSH